VLDFTVENALRPVHRRTVNTSVTVRWQHCKKSVLPQMKEGDAHKARG